MRRWPIGFLLSALPWLGPASCAMDFDAPFSQPAGVDASVDGTGGLSGHSQGGAAGAAASDGGMQEGASGASGAGHAGQAGADASAGGEDGSAGDGGSAGAADSGDEPDAGHDAPLPECKQPCATFCDKHTLDQPCYECAAVACPIAHEHFVTDPGSLALASCVKDCSGNPTCEAACCTSNPPACYALTTLTACACGYPEPSCQATCGSACNGGGMDAACSSCVQNSPCGTLAYDYVVAADSVDFRDCCTAGNWAASAIQTCCKQFPLACAARTAILECVCD